MPGAKRHFNLSERDITRTNTWKLKPYKFKAEIKGKCFKVRIIKHLNKLLREAVDSLFLDVFRSKLVHFLEVMLLAIGLKRRRD